MIEPDAISAVVRRLRVIWLALLMSVATLNAVVWFLLRSRAVSVASPLPPSTLTMLGVIVALTLVLAPYVRKRVEAAPSNATAEQIVSRWQTGWIVGQAMKEGVGIAGLAIAMLAGTTTWAWAFAIASLGSMILTPPWEHEVRRRVQHATGSPLMSPR